MGTDTPNIETQDEWNALATRYADPDAYVAIVDRDFVLRGACARAYEMFGLEPEEVIGSSAVEVIHPADLERALGAFAETSQFSGLRPPDVYRVRVNGLHSEVAEYRAFDVAGENIDDLGGAIVFQLRELPERRRAELLAIEQIEILESLGSGESLDASVRLVTNLAERHIDHSLCVVTLVAPDGQLRSLRPNDSLHETTHSWDGHRLEQVSPNVTEAANRRLSFVELDILALPHWQHVTTQNRAFTSAVTTPAYDPSGRLVGIVEILRSTSERPDNAEMSVHALAARLVGLLCDRHQFESILADAAYQDSLTGLGNRRLLKKVLTELDQAADPYVVFAIDLDQFTWINNNLGHDAGDQILAGVAERFAAVLPELAQAFRQGGDEFAILLTGELLAETGLALGRDLLDSLEEPFAIGPIERRIRASIGTAVREPGELGETVVKRADAAMYATKADGGSGVRIFEESHHHQIMRRMSLADELRTAITNNEIQLVFLPEFDLRNMRIAGVEALVRWEHPTFGLLTPEEFVPVAEESSLILALDQWVLEQAYSQLTSWSQRRPVHDPIQVWVNLSARTLDRSDLVDFLVNLVGGDPTPRLGLELTERDGFHDIAAARQVFDRLSDHGFQVAIDDFGIGQASLQHLAELEVTSIKIARSFVANMAASRRYRIMVETILTLGQSLGVGVTAEGIETREQLATLQNLGCAYGQGHFLSLPLLPDALEAVFGNDLLGRWDPASISPIASRTKIRRPSKPTLVND